MAHKQKPSQRTAPRTRWPRMAAAAFIVIAAAGALLLLLPSRIGRNGQNGPSAPAPMFTKHGTVTFINKRLEFIARFDIEIADNEVRRELGLMGRPSMQDTQAMLFIFEETRPVSFWMKNTFMSLDILMINEQKEVVTIHRNTVPLSEQTYPSDGPVRYVVEVTAGTADRLGITVGDRISWQRND